MDRSYLTSVMQHNVEPRGNEADRAGGRRKDEGRHGRVGEVLLERRTDDAPLERIAEGGEEHADVLPIRRARRPRDYFKNPS
jgi:hypothetical protein